VTGVTQGVSETRAHRRDTLALAAGTAANGLLAYVVFALTTRGLGSAQAAPVSVLWSYWAFSAAALTFPVQQWITRSVPAYGAGAVRHALPRVWAVVLPGAVGMALLAYAAREPLFHRDDAAFPVMVGLLTIGSAAIGSVRGVLSAQQRFKAVAATLALENAVRCLVIAALFVGGSTDQVAYGAALVAGHLIVVPWARSLAPADDGTTGGASDPFRFLAGTGLAQVVNQVVLTGGPVLLTVSGGTRTQVTALFAALALFRAPYMLALGLTPQAVSRTTAMVLAGRNDLVRKVEEVVVVVTLAAAVAGAAVGAWLGPPVLRLVFGDTVRLAHTVTGLLAAGSVIAVGNLASVVVALARNRPVAAARAWLLGVGVAAVAFVALAALEPVNRTVWTFLVAEAATFVGLGIVGSARPHRVVQG
jgi:O-antigen/teichoic acid export membrane protein